MFNTFLWVFLGAIGIALVLVLGICAYRFDRLNERTNSIEASSDSLRRDLREQTIASNNAIEVLKVENNTLRMAKTALENRVGNVESSHYRLLRQLRKQLSKKVVKPTTVTPQVTTPAVSNGGVEKPATAKA